MTTTPKVIVNDVDDSHGGTVCTRDVTVESLGGGAPSWDNITGKPETFPPSAHSHDASYAPIVHSHDASYAAIVHSHSYEAAGAVAAHEALANPHPVYLTQAEGDALYEPLGVTWVEVSGKPVTFPPDPHVHSAGAVTSGTIDTVRLGAGTADSTTFLRGDQTWAAPAGGSDPWTYVRRTSDFTASGAAAVDITGLSFTPAANQRYEFEAQLYLRTATATVNPRAGLAWATGLTDGIANIDQAQTASTILMARGNVNAALLTAVGGLPNTTQSWPCTVWGTAFAGASPSGTIKLQLASETAGTNVFAKTGSFLKYRTVP